MRRASAFMGCAAVLSASAAYGGVFQTITLDGDLGEWDAAALVYSNGQIGDAGNPDAAYNAVYVANDAENLYVGIRTDGPNGGTIANAWAHNLYLDADLNADTGYDSNWMAHGYDFLAQYGLSGSTYSVFAFGGATQADWTWNFLGTFGYSFSGDVFEWSIPLALLGNPDALVVQFNATGDNANGETWAAEFESNAQTYTIAVPEPASLALVALGGVLLCSRRNAGN